jgi:hypothetical protein
MIMVECNGRDLCLPSGRLYYLATPYSLYVGGIERAFIDACKVTAALIKAGYSVYSPIAHTHPIASHGGMDPMDHKIWLPFDEAMMVSCDALLVARLPGWEESYGIEYERSFFVKEGKAEYLLDIPPAWLGAG